MLMNREALRVIIKERKQLAIDNRTGNLWKLPIKRLQENVEKLKLP